VTNPATAARQGSNLPELSVSELSSSIKRTLEGAYGYVRLRGEISGFRGAHASGHCYFALKDERSKIEAVIWRSTVQSLRIKPSEGLEVVATGRVTTFPNSSRYQIVIDALEPAGIGALMALFEERKKKLAAEGLFDEARKKPCPFLPGVIGIVTSPTGAVIRDMLAGFTERFPARVIIWPVRVQGETCATEVAAAIRGFNALQPGAMIPKPDVLIIARGGGSLEDLWGFNEEIVVRAAAESSIPLISAVGHETDWTLLDLAADARAPTPTKAAEWAVPKHSELLEQVSQARLRLLSAGRRSLDFVRGQLAAIARGLPGREALIALPRQRFDATERRLTRALLANTKVHGLRLARCASRYAPNLLQGRLSRVRDRFDLIERRKAAALARIAGLFRTRLARTSGRLRIQNVTMRLHSLIERVGVLEVRGRNAVLNGLARQRRQLASSEKLLVSLSYQGVLQRGFALVKDAQGRSVRSVSTIKAGERLDIEFADGHVGARAEEPLGKKGEAGKSANLTPGNGNARSGRRDPGSQGTLF
jgi:exodeoxyribonuclease VII large subunit